LLDVVAREAEDAGQRAEGADRGPGELADERVPDRGRRIEELHRVLGEVAELDARAERDAAAIRRGGAGDELEEGRLSCAVDAHHAPALRAPDEEVEAGVDGA